MNFIITGLDQKYWNPWGASWVASLKELADTLPAIKKATENMSHLILEQSEIQLKYDTYILKEQELVKKMALLEDLIIPEMNPRSLEQPRVCRCQLAYGSGDARELRLRQRDRIDPSQQLQTSRRRALRCPTPIAVRGLGPGHGPQQKKEQDHEQQDIAVQSPAVARWHARGVLLCHGACASVGLAQRRPGLDHGVGIQRQALDALLD